MVLFSAVIYKKRGKKLINKTIKYKLDHSSKMQFAIFYPKNILNFFLENYGFSQKSGNEANSRGRRGHVLCVIMTHYLRKSICDSPVHNPNKSMINQHMKALGKNTGLYSSTYENLFFLGDFNAGMEHSDLKDFRKFVFSY